MEDCNDFQIGDIVFVHDERCGSFMGEVRGSTISTVDVFDRVAKQLHQNISVTCVEKFHSKSEMKRVLSQRGEKLA